MSFINWGSESREQLRIRKRLEEDYLQAVFEQRAANAAATAAAAGSGGIGKSSTILIIDADYNFYRYDYVTGESTPLMDAVLRPLLTDITGAVTDPETGDVWLSVRYNPCFPDRCPGAGIVRVTVDGDTLIWDGIVGSSDDSSAQSRAWNKEDSSIIRTVTPMFVPVDNQVINLIKVDTQTGESTLINELYYSMDMRLVSITSSKKTGWIWLLFGTLESSADQPNPYFLFHLDPYAGLESPLMPGDGLEFGLTGFIRHLVFDHGSSLFVYDTGGRFYLPTISSFNTKGELVVSLGISLDIVAITDLI